MGIKKQRKKSNYQLFEQMIRGGIMLAKAIYELATKEPAPPIKVSFSEQPTHPSLNDS